jgi:hypothetical protein
VGYTCICCSGEVSNILHYGANNNPNAKVINEGILSDFFYLDVLYYPLILFYFIFALIVFCVDI